MNYIQKQAALQKLAQVRLAINYVMRNRGMKKQAEEPYPQPIQFIRDVYTTPNRLRNSLYDFASGKSLQDDVRLRYNDSNPIDRRYNPGPLPKLPNSPVVPQKSYTPYKFTPNYLQNLHFDRAEPSTNNTRTVHRYVPDSRLAYPNTSMTNDAYSGAVNFANGLDRLNNDRQAFLEELRSAGR